MSRTITVLGATGSIGVSTLDVIARHPNDYSVYALTAHRNVELFVEQCREHQPRYAVLTDGTYASEVAERLVKLSPATELLVGQDAMRTVAVADDVDMVMAAIVGFAGLPPTLAAVKAGKIVLLANKESLVTGGQLFMDAAKESGAAILPIDSEHNAIYQCLPSDYVTGHTPKHVRRLLLTASGGPFRQWSHEEMIAATPEQAIAHPNWSMGQKISVDSASMMNKGLELIEACWLFNLTPDAIDVVVHPQSVIHSMVEYDDGSVLAQLGNPDMRTPIAHALAWPERIESGVGSLDIIAQARLDFEAPDEVRFPNLRLARECAAAGNTAAIVLNAANEVAVDLFLREKLSFTGIAALVETTLNAYSHNPVSELQQIFDVDTEARALAIQHSPELNS